VRYATCVLPNDSIVKSECAACANGLAGRRLAARGESWRVVRSAAGASSSPRFASREAEALASVSMLTHSRDAGPWLPELHAASCKRLREQVYIMMFIRTVVLESPMAHLPRELMYEIFSHLDTTPEREPRPAIPEYPPENAEVPQPQ